VRNVCLVKDYFTDILDEVDCQEITKAYIVSILGQYKEPKFNYAGESLCLIFGKAKENQDFITFQNIGDFIFFCETIFPGSLGMTEYYHGLAKLSFFQCYRLTYKKINIYEEMADQFTPLTLMVRKAIQK